MMRYAGVLVFALLAIPAHATPAWEVKSKWFCRGERLTLCDSKGKCSASPSKLSIMVDFKSHQFTNLAPELISPLRITDYADGTTYFSNWVGNMFTIRRDPDSPIPAYEFKAVIFAGHPIIHFGTCNPM